jgi:hypothetical protein
MSDELWRELEKRAKCNEQWKKYSSRVYDLIEAIKGKVDDDVIDCIGIVSDLPDDCDYIFWIDWYKEYFEARILLAEILETFANNGDYMELVKLFTM